MTDPPIRRVVKIPRAMVWMLMVAIALAACGVVYAIATTPIQHNYGWYTYFQGILAPAIGVVFLALAAILACARKLSK